MDKAEFTLHLESPTGYVGTTTGQCTPEQYGNAMGALHYRGGMFLNPAQLELVRQWAEYLILNHACVMHPGSYALLVEIYKKLGFTPSAELMEKANAVS